MGLKSFFMLGLQFVIHVFARLFGSSRRRGIQRFLENFRADHLRPMTAGERPLIPIWQRCTNCGLCEAACPLDASAPSPDRLSFNVLAVASWRDTTAHRIIAASARELAQCESCGACEAACPEHIPLRELARSVAEG